MHEQDAVALKNGQSKKQNVVNQNCSYAAAFVKIIIFNHCG